MSKLSLALMFLLAVVGSGLAEEAEAPLPPTPFMFAPAGGATNGPGRPAPFTPEMNADFIKKVMETSARLQQARAAIADREAELYAGHDEIKTLKARMVGLQKEINRILADDAELTDLKMSRDLLWSTMPELPRVPAPMPVEPRQP